MTIPLRQVIQAIEEASECLAPGCKGAKLVVGKVFKSNVGHQELTAWVDGLKL